MISQYSKNSPNPEYPGQFSKPPTPDPNSVEALDTIPTSNSNPMYDLPTAPSPIAGSSTVAYGPDQMLAVYAARGKVASSTTPIPNPRHIQMPPAPAAGDMRSYVHLNKGTVSAMVVDALPHPGPGPGQGPLAVLGTKFRVPVPSLAGRGRSNTMSRASEGSAYSAQTNEEEEVGNAK